MYLRVYCDCHSCVHFLSFPVRLDFELFIRAGGEADGRVWPDGPSGWQEPQASAINKAPFRRHSTVRVPRVALHLPAPETSPWLSL